MIIASMGSSECASESGFIRQAHLRTAAVSDRPENEFDTERSMKGRHQDKRDALALTTVALSPPDARGLAGNLSNAPV